MNKRDISNSMWKDKNRIRKRIAIAQIKRISECKICKIRHPATLQFHHRNGKTGKINSIVNLVNNGVSVKKLMEEVNKCEILCGNCHSIFHFNERRKNVICIPKGVLSSLENLLQ